MLIRIGTQNGQFTVVVETKIVNLVKAPQGLFKLLLGFQVIGANVENTRFVKDVSDGLVVEPVNQWDVEGRFLRQYSVASFEDDIGFATFNVHDHHLVGTFIVDRISDFVTSRIYPHLAEFVIWIVFGGDHFFAIGQFIPFIHLLAGSQIVVLPVIDKFLKAQTEGTPDTAFFFSGIARKVEDIGNIPCPILDGNVIPDRLPYITGSIFIES